MLENLIVESLEELPLLFNKNYIAFIAEKTRSITVDDQEFTLYTAEELSAKITIDGLVVSNVYALKGYVKTIKEFLGPNTMDQKGNQFSMLMLAASKVIGHDNGNLLFLDAHDSKSIYIFHPDGGDLTKTKLKLNTIIKNA
ncbi:hypothetical protein Celal_3172 [Cellulophaga algicola DSM 14237]|uniref:Uncharacterized protein n=1 Tax=Cellulophaga algicola (strain DSM 14237 / IC166 / ACAM 630) TaxID=688270 RepID=E6X4V4_CELAD|nr:hypothetical protein [Cellulophaga algicola]ADV50446.1 hypothetical protein Celal_3172 [Cellulophaga algicola DSM 14237]